MIKVPLKKSEEKYTINDLIDVMSALRNPQGGCPWDLEQNFKSIVPYTIEEAYEVADAIDRGNMDDLREELGDLLLQPIYHAQMASEIDSFTIHDVINDVTAKMISRHPHVFGDATAVSAEDVNAIWDKTKQAEKSDAQSALDGVTNALPSLLKAQKIQKKAAKVGFEWPDVSYVLDKLEEEIAEMREAVKNGTIAEQTEELGDILFVLANYGRMLGINAEEALRLCTVKFERRFRGLENDLKAEGIIDLKNATLAQMTDAWNVQKIKEKS
jgi:nucleoside triphosphate diphosphatase